MFDVLRHGVDLRQSRVMGGIVKTALGTLAVGALLAGGTAPAQAAREPTPREAKAIKQAAMRSCVAPTGRCRWHGARVSTRDPRFAWARITTEGFSGALLKRATPRAHRFRVVATQGGGVELCTHWRKHAPARVLADLRIGGLDASGAYGRCT